MSSIVLYSGGPDSLITYRWAEKNGKDPKPIYFGLNHRYQPVELDAINETLNETRIIDDLSFLGKWEDENSYIYARNAFLVMTASNYLDEEDTIYIAIQRDETDLPDRTNLFLDRMSDLISSFNKRSIRITSPWIDFGKNKDYGLDKTDMVRWYYENGFSIEELKSTRSCYSSYKNPCGNCPACFRRAVAFINNEIHEEYESHPFDGDICRYYLNAAKNGQYSEKRSTRIKNAVEKHRIKNDTTKNTSFESRIFIY